MDTPSVVRFSSWQCVVVSLLLAGQCPGFPRKYAFVFRGGIAEPASVASGQQGGGRGSAPRRYAVLIEDYPLARQPVDVRRSNRRSMIPYIGPAQVVSDDEANVGPGSRRTFVCLRGQTASHACQNTYTYNDLSALRHSPGSRLYLPKRIWRARFSL